MKDPLTDGVVVVFVEMEADRIACVVTLVVRDRDTIPQRGPKRRTKVATGTIDTIGNVVGRAAIGPRPRQGVRIFRPGHLIHNHRRVGCRSTIDPMNGLIGGRDNFYGGQNGGIHDGVHGNRDGPISYEYRRGSGDGQDAVPATRLGHHVQIVTDPLIVFNGKIHDATPSRIVNLVERERERYRIRIV